MNLWDIQKGEVAKITDISAEVEESVRNRLEEIGLSPSQQVTCLRRSPFKGPVVLQLGGSAFALEQEIAELVIAKLV